MTTNVSPHTSVPVVFTLLENAEDINSVNQSTFAVSRLNIASCIVAAGRQKARARQMPCFTLDLYFLGGSLAGSGASNAHHASNLRQLFWSIFVLCIHRKRKWNRTPRCQIYCYYSLSCSLQIGSLDFHRWEKSRMISTSTWVIWATDEKLFKYFGIFKKVEKVIYTVIPNTICPWLLSKTKPNLVLLHCHALSLIFMVHVSSYLCLFVSQKCQHDKDVHFLFTGSIGMDRSNVGISNW